MFIIGNQLESPKNTDVITSQLKFVCTNPDCNEFAGNDLKKAKPDKIKFGDKKKLN
jgi:hypothetical protein